ncbi:hypothetical protein B0T26DRAFT_631289 [Lasiosphaeria miniovina]|uniref:GST N-terminal domain-containing protein n=1 Tax=Lasiosphaeria miniovina TaxID=1954250 RepID=A0AA40BJ07_9PEZI|nr:uncharacterized protein B0T26DRAFT_631289 [Lasiosphaeria miniovina]KAK0735132.1 hypothetical protein B0T26DRAFT_631289 [Lasiosphaeria miniovina]
MASNPIVFLDIPTKEPRTTWSFNLWRTRFVLNFKGLEYVTEWVEYPDIKPRLEGHVPPHESDVLYTLPAIILPDGTYIMDSNKIAPALEALYPSPPLRLDSPLIPRLRALMNGVHAPFGPIFAPSVPNLLLSERSREYFVRTRSEDHGMDLFKWGQENGGDPAWERLTPSLQEITALLKETPDGPFFMGKEAGYVDFYWAGYLLFTQMIGVYDKFLELSGDAKAHTDFLEAMKPWSARTDH